MQTNFYGYKRFRCKQTFMDTISPTLLPCKRNIGAQKVSENTRVRACFGKGNCNTEPTDNNCKIEGRIQVADNFIGV